MKKDETLLFNNKHINPHYYYDSTGVLIRKISISEDKNQSNKKICTDSIWNNNRILLETFTFKNFSKIEDVSLARADINKSITLPSILNTTKYEKYYSNGKLEIKGEYNGFVNSKKFDGCSKNIRKTGIWNYYDSLGKKTKSESYIYNELQKFNKYKFTLVKQTNLYGLMNDSGEIVVPCIYRNIYFSADTNVYGYIFETYTDVEKRIVSKYEGFMNADGSIEIADSIYKSIHFNKDYKLIFLSKESDSYNETFYTIYNLKNHKYQNTIGKFNYNELIFFTNQSKNFDSCFYYFNNKFGFKVDNNQFGIEYSISKEYRKNNFGYWKNEDDKKGKYILIFYLFDKNGTLLKQKKRKVIWKNKFPCN